MGNINHKTIFETKYEYINNETLNTKYEILFKLNKIINVQVFTSIFKIHFKHQMYFKSKCILYSMALAKCKMLLKTGEILKSLKSFDFFELAEVLNLQSEEAKLIKKNKSVYGNTHFM